MWYNTYRLKRNPELKELKMIKLIFKILWIIISIFTTILTIYFLFANGGYGIETLKSIFSDGFFNGIKEFFVGIWEGFKLTVGL